MPNLVGTSLNQVPTNGMLGGLAYQDPEHASIKNLDLKNLSQINSEIADTAVDVFVYDTSKDSDGGAWRKRTQNTSWYNETLGTATRGTRKEFPAVAVIVAEITQLTIYDADDPDLPMWMVFNLLGAVGSNSNMLPRGGSGSESDITSIACLNGKLAVGLKDVSGTVGEGLAVIDFISELARIHRGSGSGYTAAIYRASISGRNSNNIYYGDYNSLAVIAETINDVAMTVLPNARIDSATGLPVPTIVVATDGGFSIINDNGIVTSGASGSNSLRTLSISEDNVIYFGNNSQGGYYPYDLNSGVYISNARFFGLAIDGPVSLLENISSSTNKNVLFTGDDGQSLAIGMDNGLNLINGNPRDGIADNGMIAYITSDYNTGYMHGDIKGAFLSDTDTTNAVGTELVTNGTFDNDITGWITNPFNATYPGSVTWDSGTSTIKVANPYGTNLLCGIQQTLTNLISGRQYVVTFDVTTGTTGGQYIEVAGQDISYSGVGSYSVYFTPNSSSYGLTFGSRRSGYSIVTYYDNISVKLVEEDRSVNKKGLQVFGTITKSAVATGADLIGYGFGGSASNYLRQPYTSALDFGNGDFSVVYWFKQTTHSDYQDAVNRVDAGQNNGSWLIQHINDGSIQFYVRTSGSYTTYLNSSSSKITDLGWTQIAVVRESGNYVMYFNGKKIATGAGTSSLTVNNAQLQISGRLATNNYPILTGNSISLVRVSSTVPSPEQIKKMYEDEKHLFQENAKATLYGSSDAVTALAFDDTTNLLHVGTSAGRSEFQGLRRINNTTTAVTTAISASNGLIAEQ